MIKIEKIGSYNLKKKYIKDFKVAVSFVKLGV